MKIWVIMCNDYPHGVADNESEANAFVYARMEEHRLAKAADSVNMNVAAGLYWRHYEFEMNALESAPWPGKPVSQR